MLRGESFARCTKSRPGSRPVIPSQPATHRALVVEGGGEFVGRVAPDSVRRRYVGKYIGRLFRRGAQYPVAYVKHPEKARLGTRRRKPRL